MQASDILVFLLAWWVIGCIAVAFAAMNRKRSGGLWLFLSLILGPILAALLLIVAMQPLPPKEY